jgi:hypothetical protein
MVKAKIETRGVKIQRHPSVEGVTFVSIERQCDERGTLAVFDRDTLSFTPVRAFTIFDVPRGASRGGHALSCDEFLWVAMGSCRLYVDDGICKSSILLNNKHPAVLVQAGVWLKLGDFVPGTLVFLFAPTSFSETERFDAPQPDLIAARASRHDPAG